MRGRGGIGRLGREERVNGKWKGRELGKRESFWREGIRV